MKLVLASQGFTTDEIAKEVSRLVGKPLEKIKVGVINEAYVGIEGSHDKRWNIRELSRLEKYIGGTIDFINLRAYDRKEIKKRVDQVDLIYIVGGRQFILSNLFQETGFDQILKEAMDEKVIMGTSAGAVVLGRQIEDKIYWKERYGVEEREIKNKELEFVDFNISPHYTREDHQEWTKEFLTRTLKENPFPVYAIMDTQAVICENGKVSFVGGEPEIFGKK